jgi:hypothetical protein
MTGHKLDEGIRGELHVIGISTIMKKSYEINTLAFG